MKTRLGDLIERFNHSGIDDHPPIGDGQLQELLRLAEEQLALMDDIECKPMKLYWVSISNSAYECLIARGLE